jgi:hypothetical protein
MMQVMVVDYIMLFLLSDPNCFFRLEQVDKFFQFSDIGYQLKEFCASITFF